ncbi:lipopolysaccharide biosynthesis protein [Algibacter mikhailovii]|uniref:lipopolysaccharide biosynthesis protein n=1 Tax=Algibacter mikhailovii TaxID=425498 RepID=UPI00249470DF|nr:oligosaccharide flippase family protein [Algibacter mikhailovii]
MNAIFLKIIKEDNFLSLAGNIVIAAMGFMGFALLARVLEINAFAQWVLFISGGSLVEMLRFGITNNGLVRFLSGASKNDRDQLIGANALISLIATVFIVIIIVAIRHVFNASISESGYVLFFAWYPVLAFVNLPWNNALVVLQAKMEYGKILIIKTINSGLFFLFLVLNSLWLELSIEWLVSGLIVVNLISSTVCILKNWDGFKLILKTKKATTKMLLNFGKYSTFTLIGTNLLRNADVIIISISPLGNAAVALFSIALKLTELQQIPLRSFTATAFPKMSKASLEGRIKDVQHLFHVYSGALTYLFVFMSLFTFIFAEEFVMLISGDQYLSPNYSDFNIVTLVRILTVYGVLLPIDRMTGIGLDSINKPNINALKVLIMLTANIVGDLIAVYLFESLNLVALSTLVFTCIGIGIGSFFLNQQFKISLAGIVKNGNRFYKNLWVKAQVICNAFEISNSKI